MKQFRMLLSIAIGMSLIVFLVVSCQKEVSSNQGNIPAGQAKLSIYLTDGPNDYQQVMIDIQSIVVKVDTCQVDSADNDHHDGDHHEGNHRHYRDHDNQHCDDYRDTSDVNCDIWDTLQINPGIYDLLKLQNGVDTLLASDYIPMGRIYKIKFVLGPNNSVMVDSVVHPLHLINNMNFIYVKVKNEDIDSITSNNFNLYLDFDLARSIIYWNGNYWLRPQLRPFGKHSYGEIEGKIRPVHSHGMINAYNATDTFYARPDHQQGEFKIRGLKPGMYSLFVDGINGYQDTVINNIEVKRGRETELGTITLKK